MRTKTVAYMFAMLVMASVTASNAWAAKNQLVEKVEITEKGKKLEAAYAKQLQDLESDIIKDLPEIDAKKKAAYLKACEAEKAADASRNDAQQKMGKITRAEGSVNHAKGKWIAGAEEGIKQAKEMLEKATTDAEREEAKEKLASCEKSKQDGIAALKERQALLDEAKAEEPKLIKALESAEKALTDARSDTLKALKELGLESFISSDKLDARLAKYVIISEASPRGLAEYAQQGSDQQKLIEKLLSDNELLIQMAVADGANGGRYGAAMEIYTAIQDKSKKSRDGALQRLALAVSLEHAVPVSQLNAEALTDAPSTVDPINRYLHYEQAYLNGELDSGFKDLSVWDYRMVVDGNEPDEILSWGRKMLSNYRPDHISTSDYRWRYVAAVKTEVQYGSQNNKYDKPELQFFQNILMNGGVCGRRAFFGRFILRAFGVPTTARPQKGHAALLHWTPEGWVVCLGGGFGIGWTKTRYGKDKDFLANTQAREERDAYLEVKRAQWVGDVFGEKQVFGFLSGNPDFWYGVSLYRQREIIEEAEAVELAAVGEDIGEANESKEKEKVAETVITEEDRKITVDKAGVITIPAAACSKPANSTAKIIFMKSNLGGVQLHYSRNGGAEDFEYTFDAPKAGKYALTARVVTPSWKQHLSLAVNGAEEAIDIALPFTVGMWGKAEPIDIALVKGRNVLVFSRNHDGLKGVTIRDFTLAPLK